MWDVWWDSFELWETWGGPETAPLAAAAALSLSLSPVCFNTLSPAARLEVHDIFLRAMAGCREKTTAR